MPPLGILCICLHDTIKVKYVQVFICCLYILFGHTLPYLPFIQPCAIIRCTLFIERGVDTVNYSRLKSGACKSELHRY